MLACTFLDPGRELIKFNDCLTKLNNKLLLTLPIPSFFLTNTLYQGEANYPLPSCLENPLHWTLHDFSSTPEGFEKCCLDISVTAKLLSSNYCNI